MSDEQKPERVISTHHTAYRVERDADRDVAAMQAALLYRLSFEMPTTKDGELMMGAAALMYALADGSATVRFASFHSNTGIY